MTTTAPTVAVNAIAPLAPASAPLWTLEGLRAADPVLGIALLMLVALVVAEALHRAWRLPRSCGYMLTGAVASPLVLRLLDRLELDPWKPLIDLAIGALLFELGTRIRPRWLLDNPWLAASCVLQSLLSGLLVIAAPDLAGRTPAHRGGGGHRGHGQLAGDPARRDTRNRARAAR